MIRQYTTAFQVAPPRREWAIALLAMVLIASLHGSLVEDRFLLNLYYIGIAMAVYVLMKRDAAALAAGVLAVALGTTISSLYFQAPAEGSGSLPIQLRDFAAFCGLLILSCYLAIDVYRTQCENRRLHVQREIEVKLEVYRRQSASHHREMESGPLAAHSRA